MASIEFALPSFNAHVWHFLFIVVTSSEVTLPVCAFAGRKPGVGEEEGTVVSCVNRNPWDCQDWSPGCESPWQRLVSISAASLLFCFRSWSLVPPALCSPQ